MGLLKIGSVRHQTSAPGHRLRWPVLVLLQLLWGCLAIHAQEQGANPAGTSDLALENLNRVAASATQIEEALRKDPGLLVELKRWVAKEATDQGQMLEDSNLTDQAIFDRLSRDLPFRAVATRLLRRYGYLTPKLNPESELAKEEELLRQQRVRRLLRATEVQDEDAAHGRRAEKEHHLDRTDSREPEAADTEHRGGERKRETVIPSEVLPGAPPFDLRDKTRQPLSNPIEDPEIRSRKVIRTRGGLPAYDDLSEVSTSADGPRIAAEESRLAQFERGKASLVPPEAKTGSRISSRELSSRGWQDKSTEEEKEHPAVVRRANPYADIPSLYDLYSQVSSRQPALKRFGLDVFRNGMRDSEMLPMDLPVGPDYVVGPGDGLVIDL